MMNELGKNTGNETIQLTNFAEEFNALMMQSNPNTRVKDLLPVQETKKPVTIVDNETKIPEAMKIALEKIKNEQAKNIIIDCYSQYPSVVYMLVRDILNIEALGAFFETLYIENILENHDESRFILNIMNNVTNNVKINDFIIMYLKEKIDFSKIIHNENFEENIIEKLNGDKKKGFPRREYTIEEVINELKKI